MPTNEEDICKESYIIIRIAVDEFFKIRKIKVNVRYIDDEDQFYDIPKEERCWLKSDSTGIPFVTPEIFMEVFHLTSGILLEYLRADCLAIGVDSHQLSETDVSPFPLENVAVAIKRPLTVFLTRFCHKPLHRGYWQVKPSYDLGFLTLSILAIKRVLVHLEARLSCIPSRRNHEEEKNVRHLAIEAPWMVIKVK